MNTNYNDALLMTARLEGWQPGSPSCQVVNSDGFICTREKEHDGPHVAHVTNNRIVCAWDENWSMTS